MTFQKSYHLLILFLLLSSQIYAKHIMGGDIAMKHLNNKGEYSFTLSAFIDNTEAKNSDYEATIYLRVYKKNGGSFITSIPLTLELVQDLIYENKACQQLYGFYASEFRYIGKYTFDESFNESDGYVFTWERCCRNNITNNIKISSNLYVGMLFYLETKAFFDKNGKEFINNTPDFKTPNGDFICLGNSFTMNMGAIDSDGDELKYSLVTPFRGFSGELEPYGNTFNLINFDNIPVVEWQSGFSANTAIPGAQPLNINSKTGEIKTNANQIGFYVFSVLVEEYRNGSRISASRRDFQLAVVDCPKVKPQIPQITFQNNPITNLTGCPNSIFNLEVSPFDKSLNYQWKRNGDNIEGGYQPTLLANKEGIYTVIATFQSKCATKVEATEIKINYITLPPITISPKPIKLCEGDTISISVKDSTGNKYQWLKNNQEIKGEQRSNLNLNNNGLYSIHVLDPTFNCMRKDSVEVLSLPKPIATINTINLDVCEEDSVALEATVAILTKDPYIFEWSFNDQKLQNKNLKYLKYKEKGNFGLLIRDGFNCKSDLANIQISKKNTPEIDFDPVSVICGFNNKPILLRGNPSGGTFKGIGVDNSYFNPKNSGSGNFTVEYTSKGNNGCYGSKKRQITVDEPINIELSNLFKVKKGESLKIINKVNRQNLFFEWIPNLYLDNALIQMPLTTPLYEQEYTLTAYSSLGCKAMAKTKVLPETKIYVPNIFTPNNDGMNDTWELSNIKSFSNVEVFIYNRWGDIVFYSKGYDSPFDGKAQNGESLASGNYAYIIRVESESQDLKGSILLVR